MPDQATDDYAKFIQANRVKLGQKLFVPLRRERLVVEATVVEVNDIYYDAVNNRTIWHTVNDEENVAIIQRNAQGQSGKQIPLTELPNFKLINCFPWVDFPTGGHAAYLDDTASTTLDRALLSIASSNKKHLRRRLKKFFHGQGWLSIGVYDRKYVRDLIRNMDKHRIFVRRG